MRLNYSESTYPFIKDKLFTTLKYRLKLGITLKKIFFVLFVFFSVLLFDVLITSSSIMPFRLIYDVAFSLIMIAFCYTSIFLLSGKAFPLCSNCLILHKLLYIIPTLLNLYVILSVISLEVPIIGFLNENILFQGLSALLPLLIFILVMAANAVIVYVTVNKTGDIHLFKLATYIISVIAIETSISIFAFHIAGLEGLRYGLLFFHVFLIGLTFWSYRRFKTTGICLRISTSDLLLLLLSIGLFTLVFIPFGFYNLYQDNSVIVGNTLSIVNRGSLLPYYVTDSYYSPIMGFIVVFFTYITGLNNLLLASCLPFLICSLLLPFVTYHFLSSFVTDDSRIAVLGALIVALMDGLAVILLPVYNSNITANTIHWYISSPTRSLYSSNIMHLWLTPYKILAVVSSIAACSMLDKRRVINYILAGGLFFISFMNPRYGFLSLILLVFLFGIKRIDLKGIVMFILSSTLFASFTYSVHLYKQSQALSAALAKQGLVTDSFFSYFNNSLQSLVSQDNYVFIALTMVISFLIITFLSLYKKFAKNSDVLFTSYFSQRNFPTFSVKIGKSKKKLSFSSITLLLSVILIFISIYISLSTYYPEIFAIFLSNSYFNTLNTILIRYHVLFGFFVIGLLTLKFPRRITLTIIAILLIFYFGGRLAGSVSILPLVFVILAIPLINLCVKYRRKLAVMFLLCIVFLGIFSATFYSATTTRSIDNDYSDLPYLLKILTEEGDIGEKVYSPSSYTYFVNRILKQSHMTLSSDSNYSLYLIDTRYMNATVLDSLLNDFQFAQKFVGERFVLLEKR